MSITVWHSCVLRSCPSVQSSVLSLASLDTIGKVKRKEMYEAQLAQIEKDIEKLSKKVVYVADDY